MECGKKKQSILSRIFTVARRAAGYRPGGGVQDTGALFGDHTAVLELHTHGRHSEASGELWYGKDKEYNTKEHLV